MSNLALVTGRMFSVHCAGCGSYQKAGDIPGTSCYNFEPVACDRVYADLDGSPFDSYYCEPCASKHAMATDETRSVTEFYTTTKGTELVNP